MNTKYFSFDFFLFSDQAMIIIKQADAQWRFSWSPWYAALIIIMKQQANHPAIMNIMKNAFLGRKKLHEQKKIHEKWSKILKSQREIRLPLLLLLLPQTESQKEAEVQYTPVIKLYFFPSLISPLRIIWWWRLYQPAKEIEASWRKSHFYDYAPLSPLLWDCYWKMGNEM